MDNTTKRLKPAGGSIRLQILLIFTAIFSLGMVIFGLVLGRKLGRELEAIQVEVLDRSFIPITTLLSREIDVDVVVAVVETGNLNSAEAQNLETAFDSVSGLNDLLLATYVIIRDPEDSNQLLYVSGRDYGIVELPESEFLEELFIDEANAEAELDWINPAFDGEVVVSPFFYEDELGLWMDGFAPIYNSSGDVVALVGAQVAADDILGVRRFTVTTVLISFGIIYPLLLLGVFYVSGRVVKAIEAISSAAVRLDEEEVFEEEKLAPVNQRADEIGQLSRIFSRMAAEVIKRTNKLKEQVSQLKIEIDLAKQEAQVAEITESDYFKDLQSKSKAMRQRKQGTD